MRRGARALGMLGMLGMLVLGGSTAGAAGRPLPPFHSSVGAVSAADVALTWHPGCPVGPGALARLSVSYVGFDHRAHTGTIVVARSVVGAVRRVFALLYAKRFPIRSMRPEEDFGGSDPRSMAADNTSGFNCRLAVASGPPSWSEHAYGLAIDVNPVENPYVFEHTVEPAAGRAFIDRHDVRPGMAVSRGALVSAFASIGWYWGGRWAASPDYQHFSENGR